MNPTQKFLSIVLVASAFGIGMPVAQGWDDTGHPTVAAVNGNRG